MSAQPRPAGAADVAKTVLSGLVGIRRKSDHERVLIRPWQVVVAGIALAALLVVTLVMVVRFVVAG